MQRGHSASIFDRLISVATYLTLGMAGILWLILSFFLKNRPGSFLSYHIYQSIFLSLLIYILSLLFSISIGLLSNIPLLNTIVNNLLLFFNTPVYFGFSLVHLTILIIILYLSLGAVLGKYSYLPFISDIIGSNFGG